MPFPKGNFFPKNESVDGWYSRGYLPHVDREGMTQLVCDRLWDSMPKEVLEGWKQELTQLLKEDYDLERRKRIDAYLDQGWGSCLLRDARAAEIVQNNWLHFAGDRYILHAWVVMPNHTHILFTPLPGGIWPGSFIPGKATRRIRSTSCLPVLENFGRMNRSTDTSAMPAISITRWRTSKIIR